MGKKEKEKRKKNKDVRQLNEEFSSELTRGRNPEGSREPGNQKDMKDMKEMKEMKDLRDVKEQRDSKDKKDTRRGNC